MKKARLLLEVGLASTVFAMPKVIPMELILAFLLGMTTVLVVMDASIAYIMQKKNLPEKSLDFINFMAVLSARVRVAEGMLGAVFITYFLFFIL